MYGYTALSWSGPDSTHPHCADRLVFKVGRWLCISRADRCIVYIEKMYTTEALNLWEIYSPGELEEC